MSRDDSPTVGTGRRGRNGPIRGRFRGRRSLAPAVLAEHGIPDFTPWVRSAYADRNGKIVGPTNRLRSAERALQLPFVALNQRNAIRVLALDCYHPDDFRHAIWARKLPQPGIEVWRDGGGLLALWPLARRVPGCSAARPNTSPAPPARTRASTRMARSGTPPRLMAAGA